MRASYLSLQQRNDFAAQYFPLLVVGTNIAFFTLAVPLGRLSDRIGRHKAFIAGHVPLVAPTRARSAVPAASC